MSCCCHINPPCGYCTERVYCEKCGESFVYESADDVLCETCFENTHSTNYYRVDRYFDDHLECTIAKGLTLEEATSLVKEQNKINRAYVEFIVREEAQ